MNVNLPDEHPIKKKQIIIYVSILVVCIICVIVAFYVQFYARIDIGSLVGITSENALGQKTEEEIQTLDTDFGNLFVNTVQNDNGENNNKKQDESKPLVYTNYEKKESKLNSYD